MIKIRIDKGDNDNRIEIKIGELKLNGSMIIPDRPFTFLTKCIT